MHPRRYRESRWPVVVGFLVPTCILLLPDLISGHFFAFRDAGSYYFPLYEWIGQHWRSGQSVPLWNPHENGGLPLVSDPTAALWYPGKWIFAAPLPYPVCFQIFLCSHVVLAWWGLYFVCRLWNRSQVASSIAAASYAFGGYVLFQVSNPPYLIGAAWLPWAIACGESSLRRGNRQGLVAAACCLSLMILGGDPQTAIHTMIALALYLIWHASWVAWMRLATLVLTTCVLSSVVVLPSSTWVDRTDRATESPRSVWDLLDGESDGGFSDLVAEPTAGTHDEKTYRYSYTPGRWSEWLWPNISGDLFPKNGRWIKQWSANRRTWVPSLYMGMLTIVAACSVWAVRGQDRRRRWMSRLLVISLIAACGKYGLVAIGEHFFGDSRLAGGVGGLYHGMVTLIPGYQFFRYPAKWLVFSSLAIACLSAWGVDGLLNRESGRPARHGLVSAPKLTAIITAATLLALIVHLSGWTDAWFHRRSVDRLFGPFDSLGARWCVTVALLHTLFIGGGLLILQQWTKRWPNAAKPHRGLAWALLIIAIADLMVANHRLTPAVSNRVWRPPTGLAAEQDVEHLYPIRVQQLNQMRYMDVKDRERIYDQRWQEANRNALPKHHMLARPELELVEVTGSAAPQDWQRLERATSSKRAFLALIGVERVMTIEPSRTGHDSFQVTWETVESSEPRFWIAEMAIDLSRGRDRRLSTTTWNRIASRQPGTVFLAGPSESTDESTVRSGSRRRGEYVKCVSYGPNAITLNVRLHSPGWVVINDRFHPGWRSHFTTGSNETAQPRENSPEPLDVLCANGWARAVRLPAGNHRVTMQFRPLEFLIGARLSLAAWLISIGYLCWPFVNRRR